MKNSRVLYVLLLLAGNFCATLGTAQLDGFLKAVDEAHGALEGLVGLFADRAYRRKRSIGEMLARFGDEAELDEGDAWYKSFRAMECEHGGGCEKKPLRWVFKENADDYVDDGREIGDQGQETANDLSHEANYKLSKVEQEAEEKSLPNAAWRGHHTYKRRVNPMEAVKLKTRLRRLKTSGRRSLPEKVSDGMPTQTRKDSADLWRGRYGVRSARKLLSIEESESEVDNLSALRADLMRTDAFIKLQNYLEETQAKKNVSSSTKQVAIVPLNLDDKDRDVNIKLRMSVNATVLGDNRLPENFHRNNTVTFKPPLEAPKDGEEPDQEQMRDRRRVVFPIMPGNQEIRKSVIEAMQDFPLDDIVSGKLTSQLVDAVFEVVKTSPSLKVLWPGLKRNRVPATSRDAQNFDAIRTEDNEFELHRAGTMLRQAMEAISAIIDQQIRSSSCAPLPSDLRAFHNLILRSQVESERSQERRKREATTLSETQLRQKSKVVKKLLRDYEELPRDDQEQVASVKKTLLVAAQQLRELQQQANRRKRQTPDFEDPAAAEHNFTAEYAMLAKTAELLSQTSLKDPDSPLGLSYI